MLLNIIIAASSHFAHFSSSSEIYVLKCDTIYYTILYGTINKYKRLGIIVTSDLNRLMKVSLMAISPAQRRPCNIWHR